MNSSKNYSRDKLRLIMDQNEAEVNSLMTIFVQMVPEMLKEMLAYSKDDNWTSCSFLAHKLKSSVRLWDIQDVDEDIVFIELNGRKSLLPNEVRQKIENINTILSKVIDDMKHELDLANIS